MIFVNSNARLEFAMFKPVIITIAALAATQSFVMAADIGSEAPAWRYLQGVDGKLHNLSDYDKDEIVVVAFLCNKCPCVKGYEARFNRFTEEFGKQGVRFVGINSSIGELENLNTMKQRMSDGKLKFDYLRDETQKVARGFSATSTPHVSILNKQRCIVYSGAFDDNRSESAVTKNYVVDSVNAMLNGKPVPVEKTQQFGCTITYR